MIASGQTVDTAYFLGLLAQLEAEADGAESGLARLDEAFALVDKCESRFYLALLHRLRGDLLLKSNPRDSASAEGAYHAAIAVAQQQGARSYELAGRAQRSRSSTSRPAARSRRTTSSRPRSKALRRRRKCRRSPRRRRC